MYMLKVVIVMIEAKNEKGVSSRVVMYACIS
jgi:hypothetical protein